MSTIVCDCPRCGAGKITFDVKADLHIYTVYDWQKVYELFCVCRSCSKSTVFIVKIRDYKDRDVFKSLIADKNFDLTDLTTTEGFICLKDLHAIEPPDYLPQDIKAAFTEAASCLAIGCYNAASAMFRLCLDLATKPLLPDATDANAPQPNVKQRRDLGLRIQWLLENGLLPDALSELAKCIREDANDGAHAGNLSRDDAEDILDFTYALLERLITEPAKLDLAQKRRDARRGKG